MSQDGRRPTVTVFGQFPAYKDLLDREKRAGNLTDGDIQILAKDFGVLKYVNNALYWGPPAGTAYYLRLIRRPPWTFWPTLAAATAANLAGLIVGQLFTATEAYRRLSNLADPKAGQSAVFRATSETLKDLRTRRRNGERISIPSPSGEQDVERSGSLEPDPVDIEAQKDSNDPSSAWDAIRHGETLPPRKHAQPERHGTKTSETDGFVSEDVDQAAFDELLERERAFGQEEPKGRGRH